MFYERDILEGLTKKTFYDSPRIVLTDLEHSLLAKTNTSLVSSIIYKHVDTAIKCVTSTCVGPHGPGSSRSFLYTEVAETLVKANADPNVQIAQIRTALQLAEEADYGRGHSEVAKVLYKHGARVAIRYVSKNNLQDMVTDLISNDHNLEECDEALVRAGEEGHRDREVVGVLMAGVIAAGKDVNSCLQSSGGKTLLMYASKVGHEGFVCALIEKGASLDSVDTSGRPDLQPVVEPTPDGSRGHIEVVGVMIAAALAAGQDVNTCLGSKERPSWHTRLNLKP
jgi:predicted regulator of Ras-like GTPase activity (Roadblock/LC7/MglB family)